MIVISIDVDDRRTYIHTYIEADRQTDRMQHLGTCGILNPLINSTRRLATANRSPDQ